MSAEGVAVSGAGRRRLVALGGVVVVIAVVAIACCSGIVNEIIPRRAVVTPVLVMEIDLGSKEPQSRSFSFEYAGRYSVNAEFELRHGPQGARAEHEEFRLAGAAEILDAGGESRLERSFERSLLDEEVRAKLFEFDTDEVGREGEKLFRLAVKVDPEFREHYSEMTVFIRKEMKYPIVD